MRFTSTLAISTVLFTIAVLGEYPSGECDQSQSLARTWERDVNGDTISNALPTVSSGFEFVANSQQPITSVGGRFNVPKLYSSGSADVPIGSGVYIVLGLSDGCPEEHMVQIGIKLTRTQFGVVHQAFSVVDGTLSLVGLPNFDPGVQPGDPIGAQIQTTNQHSYGLSLYNYRSRLGFTAIVTPGGSGAGRRPMSRSTGYVGTLTPGAPDVTPRFGVVTWTRVVILPPAGVYRTWNWISPVTHRNIAIAAQCSSSEPDGTRIIIRNDGI